jgi:hypothetical protein
VARSEPLAFRHCLRDKHGRPVPYINIWSGEMPEETWRITHDTALNMPGIAVPVAKRGIGEPDFTRQAPDRQRECMLRQWCQICTTPRAEWLVVSNSVGTRTITYKGAHRLVLTEPWMCKPCADFAIATCPALIRRRHDDDLMLCRPIRFQFGFSQGWIEGPLEAQSQREMPAMWGELHVSEALDEKGRPFTLHLKESA